MSFKQRSVRWRKASFTLVAAVAQAVQLIRNGKGRQHRNADRIHRSGGSSNLTHARIHILRQLFDVARLEIAGNVVRLVVDLNFGALRHECLPAGSRCGPARTGVADIVRHALAGNKGRQAASRVALKWRARRRPGSCSSAATMRAENSATCASVSVVWWL